MNIGTQRNVTERKGVAHLDLGMSSGHNLITHSQALRSKDVAARAVIVADESNICAAVRIVLNTLNLGRNIVLNAEEINNTIPLLVTAADVTGGNAAGVVTSAGLALCNYQSLKRSSLVKTRSYNLDYMTTTSRSRFALYNCHNLLLFTL